MKKNITIVDIAKATGLSVATVSRAINKHESVKEETMLRVLEAAETLGYQENGLARGLNNFRSNMVGMLIPDIRTPFYGRIFSECEKMALQKGYVLSLCNSFNSLKTEMHFYSHLLAQRACGVIQIGGSLDRHIIPIQLFNQIQATAERIPVITSTPVPDTKSRCVYVDNARSMRKLMEYLIRLGHRKIAFVGGRNNVTSTIEKRKTYSKVLEENGISEMIICEGEYGQEYGYIATKRLFRQSNAPTAIIAITDMCAIGVLQALNELGLQCGRDVSVVSFDNTYIADMLEPELTSISVDYEKLSETIMDTMVAMIEKKETEDVFNLPLNFTIRKSCSKI